MFMQTWPYCIADFIVLCHSLGSAKSVAATVRFYWCFFKVILLCYVYALHVYYCAKHAIVAEVIFSSQLDVKSPVFASAADILLLLFSSTSLDDIKCPLYALYQFILRRPKLNAGGVLLPKLVQLYLWLHNELNHTLPLVDASETTVGGVVSYLEEKDPVEQNNSRLIKTVKGMNSNIRFKLKPFISLYTLIS